MVAITSLHHHKVDEERGIDLVEHSPGMDTTSSQHRDTVSYTYMNGG